MTLHRMRAITRGCIIPKSPDTPCRADLGNGAETRWSVTYDPDDAWTPNNRLGTYEIVACLRAWSFIPGTVLVERLNNGHKREWHVATRDNNQGGLHLDAWSYEDKGCQKLRWLKKDLKLH